MTAFDRLKILADKRKISIAELEQRLDFGVNSLYAWKRQTPSGKNLQKVADYFGTSTDYLLERTDSPFNEKDVDRMLGSAEAYNGQPMTDHDKEVIKAMIKGYMEAKPKDWNIKSWQEILWITKKYLMR